MSSSGQMDKQASIHTMEYHSEVKKMGESQSHDTKKGGLKGYIL